MAMRLSLGLVSLLVGTACASPAPLVTRFQNTTQATAPEVPKMQLIPVSNADRVHTAGRNIAPAKDLNLAWRTADNASIVAVAMSMQHPAVVLEDIDDVTGVDCTGQASVAVTFRDADAFNEALTSWSGLNDSFVMITNHLGDCDSELERSFFVADTDTLASYETNLTIIAKAEKKDVYSTAHSTDINFNNVATPASEVDKRGINFDKEGLTVAYDYTVPAEHPIFIGNVATITVHEGQFNNSATYGGHIKWELLDGVTEFTIDMEKTMWHHVDLTVRVAAKMNDTWSFGPDPLMFSAIDVPGILSLGPSAGVSLAGTIISEAGVSVTADVTSSMPKGSVHLDFINWDQSTSTGWEVQHDTAFNVSEDVKVTLKPSIDFTVEFACNVLDGLIDLSTGIKAQPSFPFITSATLTQDLNATGAADPTPTEACGNGLGEKVQFEFSIIAFASKWVSAMLYDYKTDIYNGCLNW